MHAVTLRETCTTAHPPRADASYEDGTSRAGTTAVAVCTQCSHQYGLDILRAADVAEARDKIHAFVGRRYVFMAGYILVGGQSSLAIDVHIEGSSWLCCHS